MNVQEQINQYMTMPLKQWPDSLHETVQNAGKKWGHSGDVFAECIHAWLLAGQKVLTTDEIISTLENNK